MRIAHIITSLDQGGAEEMLYKLVTSPEFSVDQQVVISLRSAGVYGEKLKQAGITYYCLNWHKVACIPVGIVGLLIAMYRFKPDIIHGWMYHANLVAYFMKKLSAHAKLVWGIRQSLYDIKKENKLTQKIIGYCAKRSQQVDCILYNSRCSMQQHQALGFSSNNAQFIANGFDLQRFRPNYDLYQRFRTRRKWPKDTYIIVMLARYHPVKNHLGFLQLVLQLKKTIQHPVRFIMAGRAVDSNNHHLQQFIEQNGLVELVDLIGEVDSASVLPACDLLISCSFATEAFSNVLGEAMSCGVPCVATDVGDARRILPNLDDVVAAGDIDLLAARVHHYLSLDQKNRAEMAKQVRHYVSENFSIECIAQQYRQAYQALAHS